MDATGAITIQPLSTDALTAKAAVIAREHPEMDKWKYVYEPAKAAIKDFNLSADEYERAMQLLTEALGI